MNIEKDNLEAIIQRYILDQLDERDAEDFEAYFLSRPDVADMVSSAHKMSVGLRTLETETVSVVSQATSDSGSLIEKLSGLFSGPAPAFAMAALLVVVSPFALQGLSQIGDGSNVELVSLQSSVVRSADSGAENGIDLSVTEGRSAVIVRVKEVRFPNYILSVKSASSEDEVWRSSPFEFASGSRDSLLLLPEHASISRVDEAGQEIEVDFCDYTESCF